MATMREELHALIDKLPEERITHLLHELTDEIEQPQMTLEAWLAGARQIRAELEIRHGDFPSVVDILNEIREERLDDFMGSE